MKQLFEIGSRKNYTRTVESADTAAFESGVVHSAYATFALARDAEWAGRLFVLDMKEADEEGIGTFVTVTHHSPAMVGEQVVFEVVIDDLHKNVINCSYAARVGERLIAEGRTGQMILKRDKLNSIFEGLKK